MAVPSLTVTIDRTGMVGAPAPLVLVASRSDVTSNTVLGVSGYREPARQMRRRTAPSSDFSHGDVTLGWSWQQSILAFDVTAKPGSTETQVKAAISELEAALARLQFEVTVEVGDAPALTWTCDAGEAIPTGDRSYADLRAVRPSWSVSIPCHTVPTEV